jgi:hypothetical protein
VVGNVIDGLHIKREKDEKMTSLFGWSIERGRLKIIV